MPTYEYACRTCGEHLEVVQSFTDDSLETCPACGGSLRKVFGNVGIVFKGSGFYKTDSRQSASGKTAAAPASSAGSGDGAGGSDGAGKAASGSDGAAAAPASKRADSSGSSTASPAPASATPSKPVAAAS